MARQKSESDMWLDQVEELENTPHVQGCVLCKGLCTMALCVGDAKYRTTVVRLIRAHEFASRGTLMGHSCDTQFPCIRHDELSLNLAKRMIKLARYKEGFSRDDTRFLRGHVTFQAVANDHPEGFYFRPHWHAAGKKCSTAYPCNGAGGATFDARRSEVLAHICVWFDIGIAGELLSPSELVNLDGPLTDRSKPERKLEVIGGHEETVPDPELVFRYMERRLTASSQWANAKYDDLKALAEMDLEINPSGRKSRIKRLRR